MFTSFDLQKALVALQTLAEKDVASVTVTKIEKGRRQIDVCGACFRDMLHSDTLTVERCGDEYGMFKLTAKFQCKEADFNFVAYFGPALWAEYCEKENLTAEERMRVEGDLIREQRTENREQMW